MTREEAIQELQNCKDLIEQDGQDYLDERDIPLLDMAIESLSAGAEWIPCDTSGMPPEGEAVLMSDGKHIWIDETVAWWGDRSDWIGTAWMPLPKPYKGGDTANYTTEKPNDKVEQKNDVVVEPTDLISRADAIGVVQDHFNADGFKGYDDGQKMMDRIKALPSADRPSMEWKPVSEGLPQSVGSYIVTCKDEHGWVYVDYDYWTVADEFKYNRDKVTAWIPFPRPYCEAKKKSGLYYADDRPTGEWTDMCACSICGFQPWYEGDIHTLSYCPNCGAKMGSDT